jgi:L-alanine-DL-glutamate epimerase-like enolase superfamily enzyme
MPHTSIPIDRARTAAYLIPTDSPESDGTLTWDSTTMVTVRIEAGGKSGFGYTYADSATAVLIRDKLAALLLKCDALAIGARWRDMTRAIRNLGRPGIASMAISAVDMALWDLKAKLLDVPLAALLGSVHHAIPVYGSGGFTSYPVERLQQQLHDWAASGMKRVKMKIGREPDQDLSRVRAAREVIGSAELFVDANGAYQRKQALAFAQHFHDSGVTWFEEPVSSDDLAGLRLLRDHGPSGMAISAGEYGYDLPYFRRMLEAQAVDILQADATRCGGVTGFLAVAALSEAFGIPLSSHCAPTLHVALCCAAPTAVHLEYFHDHARIEQLLFDGVATPDKGMLSPGFDRPGFGIEFKEQDAQCFLAS